MTLARHGDSYNLVKNQRGQFNAYVSSVNDVNTMRRSAGHDDWEASPEWCRGSRPEYRGVIQEVHHAAGLRERRGGRHVFDRKLVGKSL
jgi:hypothetical protein